MLAFLAAATLMLAPVEWLPQDTPQDLRPPCKISVNDPKTGRMACLYWGHAERIRAARAQGMSALSPDKAAEAAAIIAKGAPIGFIGEVEKPRRDAIATALASTPSGQCAVGVTDPEGDFLCAVTAP
jgi:hypothetical protein